LTIWRGDDSPRLWKGLTPLRQPLTARGIHSSFVAVWSEPHEVIITLPTHSGISDVDGFVKGAAEHVGYYQDRPPFDVTWRAYDNGILVGSGSGNRGALGVFLGGSTRGFTFGTFPAKAGRTYSLVVDVGPRFEPLLQVGPSVEVGVATASASVGLAFADSFRRSMACGVGTLGAVTLVMAAWYQHAKGRPTGG